MISYDNLWKVMKEKGISQYALIKQYKVSPGQITRLKRNESVSTHTIEMFCRILNCQVGDIMKYIPDESEEQDGKFRPTLFFAYVIFFLYRFPCSLIHLLKRNAWLLLAHTVKYNMLDLLFAHNMHRLSVDLSASSIALCASFCNPLLENTLTPRCKTDKLYIAPNHFWKGTEKYEKICQVNR